MKITVEPKIPAKMRLRTAENAVAPVESELGSGHEVVNDDALADPLTRDGRGRLEQPADGRTRGRRDEHQRGRLRPQCPIDLAVQYSGACSVERPVLVYLERAGSPAANRVTHLAHNASLPRNPDRYVVRLRLVVGRHIRADEGEHDEHDGAHPHHQPAVVRRH
jgi:hypothetical protein